MKRTENQNKHLRLVSIIFLFFVVRFLFTEFQTQKQNKKNANHKEKYKAYLCLKDSKGVYGCSKGVKDHLDKKCIHVYI